MASNLISYFKKTRNKLLLGIFAVLLILALLYIFGAPEIYERSLPKLVKGYIVLREENEPIAENKDRTDIVTRNIIMYAVIEAKELLKNETTFFTEAERISIDGNEINQDRIEKWDDFWPELKIGWIKIESLFPKFKRKVADDLSIIRYKHRWRFDSLYYWALPADAKPTELIEWEVKQVMQSKKARFSDPREYPGTMYFQIRGVIYGEEDMLNPIREVATPGDETAGAMGLSPEVRRVTLVEDRNFAGYCTGFLNVPVIQDGYDIIEKTNATERYMAITDKSYIFQAAIQAGYPLAEKSINGLRKITDVVHKDLFLRTSNYIYIPGAEGKMVKFGAEGIQRGDILVIGQQQKLAVVLSDGGMDSKPDGYFDGTDVIIGIGEKGLEKQYLAYIVDDKFDVWRLKDNLRKVNN